MKWYLYILECRDQSFYTGITDNLKRRFKEHKERKGGHYTKYTKPIKIIHSEEFENRTLAEEREKQIKRWTQAKKLALIKQDLELLRKLSKSRD